MSVTDFFEYLLGNERSSQLGSELLAVYAARLELAPRRPAGVASGR